MVYVLNLGSLDLLAAPYLVQDRTIRVVTVQGKPALQFVMEITVPGASNDGLYAAVARVQEQINLARRARRHNPQGPGVYVEVALQTEQITRWRVVDGTDIMPTVQSIDEVSITVGRRVFVPVSLTLESLHGHADRHEIPIEGAFDNESGTILVESVRGEHAGPLRMRLQVTNGDTVSGFRVGLRSVPAGTVASDWTGLLDLTAAGDATSPEDGTALGGEVAQQSVSSMTAWEPVAYAEQPDGALWQGRFVTYARLRDDPGTPSVSVVTGLAGTVTGPTVSGKTPVDVETATPPNILQQASQSDSSGTGASVAHQFVNITIGSSPLRDIVVAVAAAATAPETVNAFSTPSNWSKLSESGIGTQSAIAWFLRIPLIAPANITGSTTVTFSASTAYTVSSRHYVMQVPTGASTSVDDLVAAGAPTSQQGVAAFASQRSTLHENELALLAVINPASQTIARAFDGWTVDVNGSGALAVLRKVVPKGTVSAAWRTSALGTSAIASLVTLVGALSTGTAYTGGSLTNSGNLRPGVYTATAQRLDGHGNVSAAATPVPKTVDDSGSSLLWTWDAGSGGPYVFSWGTPDGRFRKVQTREPRYLMTDDDAGSVILALPTTGVGIVRPSSFRFQTGTPDAVATGAVLADAGTVTLADDDTWVSTIAGAWDWSQTPPDDDGNRPRAAVLIDAVSGSPASATVRADMLRLFDADGLIFTVLTSEPCSLVHLELLPDGTLTAWGQHTVGEEIVTYDATIVGEPRIQPGTVLMSIEALGAVSELVRAYASDLGTGFTIEELSYLPEVTLQVGSE